MRATLGDLKLTPHDWKSFIDSISPALNVEPLPRLGKNADGSTRCPLQVMIGLRMRLETLCLTIKHFTSDRKISRRGVFSASGENSQATARNR